MSMAAPVPHQRKSCACGSYQRINPRRLLWGECGWSLAAGYGHYIRMKESHNNLQQLIRQRNIVQHYTHSQPSHHNPLLYHNQHPLFYEDEIFQELGQTAIVEDYTPRRHFDDLAMEVEERDEPHRMEEEDPYEELFPQHSLKGPTIRNIMDSSGSDREFPQRKSSVSSVESQPENEVFSPLLMRPQEAQAKVESFLKPHWEDDRRGRRRQVDSSTEKRERLGRIRKLKEVGCNCKKSKCLKMYCECFNMQILCGENCNCVDCGNLSENEHHQRAVLDALTRNPKAFAEDAQAMPTVFQLGLDLAEVKKGCKCRKTQCRKKYCECFNSGQACGVFCQCEGCANLPSPR